MIPRGIICTLVCAFTLAAEMRVSTFRADATPAPGEPLIWTDPARHVVDPLWAKGVVIEDGKNRYVLCAVDWCGIGSSIRELFRERMAAAAGTSASRVMVQTVHQHTAPYVDGDAYRMMLKLPKPPLVMSDAFLDKLTGSVAAAVKESLGRLQRFDRVGTGMAEVEQIASARRILVDGKVLIRYSGGAKDPRMAQLPEGDIDRSIRVVTLAAGSKPLVRLYYYATHPQTWCCDGSVSADFVGAAREKVEQSTGVFQVYFTGCSGDVTAGKYNDGSEPARKQLALRLEQGMRAAADATRFAPAGRLAWRTAEFKLPPKTKLPNLDNPEKRDGQDLYRAALALSFNQRTRPLEATVLSIGDIRILHLPGEPMLEFQKFAQAQRPGSFVAVAGYGDISPGYMCTDEAHRQGGYEPSASNGGPGTEAAVKQAIRKVLAE